MDKLLVLILPELARNVPAIILAAVAAASLWGNARALKSRFSEVVTGLESARSEIADMRTGLAPLPLAFERLALAERELSTLRQQQHDANLIARAYVTRDEVREGLSNQGNALHTKLNELAGEVRVLKDRSDRA